MKVGSIGSNKSQQNFSQSQRRPGQNFGFDAILRRKLQDSAPVAVPAWIPAVQSLQLPHRELSIRA